MFKFHELRNLQIEFDEIQDLADVDNILHMLNVILSSATSLESLHLYFGGLDEFPWDMFILQLMKTPLLSLENISLSCDDMNMNLSTDTIKKLINELPNLTDIEAEWWSVESVAEIIDYLREKNINCCVYG